MKIKSATLTSDVKLSWDRPRSVIDPARDKCALHFQDGWLVVTIDSRRFGIPGSAVKFVEFEHGR